MSSDTCKRVCGWIVGQKCYSNYIGQLQINLHGHELQPPHQ